MINPKFDQFSKKQTCLFGAMMGDALGVPFEFKKPSEIIESYIINPLAIPKVYSSYDVPLGVYSDDFSQSLCVEECLNNSSLKFGEEMLRWMDGKYWVDNNLFDMGIQTARALHHFKNKGIVLLSKNDQCGNGGIMRLAPVVFTDGVDHNYWVFVEVIDDYTMLTHNNDTCLASAQFYCTLLGLLKHKEADKRFDYYWTQAEFKCDWTPICLSEPKGTGYVIDTLLSIKYCMNNSTDYTSAIIQAILLGNDTDTTATCVGAVAALYYGLKGIPDEWIEYIQPSLKNEYVQQLFKDVL